MVRRGQLHRKEILFAGIEELRNNLLGTVTQCAFSSSSMPLGRSSSRVSREHTPRLAQVASHVTPINIEDVRSLSQLPQDTLSVDMSNGHQISSSRRPQLI